MAVDCFLHIDGCQGESQDDKHKNDIDILAWSWGMSQSGTFHVGGGGGAGKANFQDMSCTKWIDKASTKLMQYCATGDHFTKAQIICRKAGKKPLEYLIIKMHDVLITSVSTGGSGGEDRFTENCTLNFAKFEIKYVEQTKDGAEGAKPEFKYDIQSNVEF